MNPTGGEIRNDAGGAGYFGAPRKKILHGNVIRYKHKGVDYTCRPGQTVWSPCTGLVARIARPYATGTYSGLLIESKRLSLKIFYIQPYESLIGQVIKIGSPIGKAQDISLKYKEFGVTPHVHVEIEACDPEIIFGDGKPKDSVYEK